jgi:hypothetical protein
LTLLRDFFPRSRDLHVRRSWDKVGEEVKPLGSTPAVSMTSHATKMRIAALIIVFRGSAGKMG